MNMKYWIVLFGTCLIFGTALMPDLSADVRPLAFIWGYKPEVKIMNRADKRNLEAKKAEQLFSGDTLATGANGYAAVRFIDKSLAKVKPNSLLILSGSVDNRSPRSAASRILLNMGSIFVQIEPRNQRNFEVATSKAVAAVKGTEFGAVSGPDGSSMFWVKEGEVVVTVKQTGQKVSLTTGMFGRVPKEGDAIETGHLSPQQLRERLRVYDAFDRITTPHNLKLHFRNDDGQRKDIDLDYYENGNR